MQLPHISHRFKPSCSFKILSSFPLLKNCSLPALCFLHALSHWEQVNLSFLLQHLPASLPAHAILSPYTMATVLSLVIFALVSSPSGSSRHCGQRTGNVEDVWFFPKSPGGLLADFVNLSRTNSGSQCGRFRAPRPRPKQVLLLPHSLMGRPADSWCPFLWVAAGSSLTTRLNTFLYTYSIPCLPWLWHFSECIIYIFYYIMSIVSLGSISVIPVTTSDFSV